MGLLDALYYLRPQAQHKRRFRFFPGRRPLVCSILKIEVAIAWSRSPRRRHRVHRNADPANPLIVPKAAARGWEQSRHDDAVRIRCHCCSTTKLSAGKSPRITVVLPRMLASEERYSPFAQRQKHLTCGGRTKVTMYCESYKARRHELFSNDVDLSRCGAIPCLARIPTSPTPTGLPEHPQIHPSSSIVNEPEAPAFRAQSSKSDA
ncbi:hypothetical protein C8R46DRAFT_656859 [Mycena filopes]|nr:hypothetical protein C8R46DRAFT_656859 [Mycena filopes]